MVRGTAVTAVEEGEVASRAAAAMVIAAVRLVGSVAKAEDTAEVGSQAQVTRGTWRGGLTAEGTRSRHTRRTLPCGRFRGCHRRRSRGDEHSNTSVSQHPAITTHGHVPRISFAVAMQSPCSSYAMTMQVPCCRRGCAHTCTMIHTLAPRTSRTLRSPGHQIHTELDTRTNLHRSSSPHRLCRSPRTVDNFHCHMCACATVEREHMGQSMGCASFGQYMGHPTRIDGNHDSQTEEVANALGPLPSLSPAAPRCAGFDVGFRARGGCCGNRSSVGNGSVGSGAGSGGVAVSGVVMMGCC